MPAAAESAVALRSFEPLRKWLILSWSALALVGLLVAAQLVRLLLLLGVLAERRALAEASIARWLAPRRIGGQQPSYPKTARQAGIQGMEILEVLVDASGTVREAKVLRGLPMGLDEAAVRAVKTWKLRPAQIRGRSLEVPQTITVSFRLQ